MTKGLLVTIALALLASAAGDPAVYYGYGGYPYSAAVVAAPSYSSYVLPYAYSSAYQVQDWSAPLVASAYTYPYANVYPYYKR